MLNFLRRERKNRQETERQSLRQPVAQAQPEGHEEAQVEPEFPTLDEAREIHDQSLLDHGQPQAHLINPDYLEGALGRAANYWYYGDGSPEEKMADAAGALAHGVGAAQAFEDGNKRTAYHTARYFLHNNGYGHLSPVDHDDDELADHLLGHGEGTHSLEDTQGLFRSRMQQRTANILDPIHDDLDPRVWDDPASPEPTLKPEHSQFLHEKIFSVLEANGYDGMERWLSLVFTGSLTTYQYADHSDVDISLFVDTKNFPEWSRAEMIGVMIENTDGTLLPGTPFPLQCFVVPPGITKQDLYKPGLRSGYDLATDTWLVPPDRNRVHDVEHEMNEAYTIALENADKMDKLLRYEPEKAVQFWHQIHERRKRDQAKGRGDYAPSNITYKMLANRGLFPKIEEASGEYLAKTADYPTPDNLQNYTDHLHDRLGPEALDADDPRSPWQDENYWENDPQYAYRAMSEEHFQDSMKKGFHQSDERGNYQAQAEKFGEDPSEVPKEGTVAGRWSVPGYIGNSPSGVGRVVKIRLRPEDGWEEHPEEEALRTFKPIPTDRFEAWTNPIDAKTWKVMSKTKKAEYEGWSNWDTWNAKLMMDNEYEHYKQMHDLIERGGSPDDLRDWALQKVIGPYNRDRIQEAREWNEIPEAERIDHHYDQMREESPEATDLYDKLMGPMGGGGPDLSDDEPDLIDPEMVNWHEIHQNVLSGYPEDERPQQPQSPVPDTLPPNWAKVSHYENQLQQIAQSYNAAPTYEPEAHAAWEELAADSKHRADQIRQQYNYTVTDDPEPYANGQEMLEDIRRGNFTVSRANSEHPIWTPEQNVDFRTVHDVLGHGTSGGDFSWEGENQACAAHAPLLSPAAQKALFTECIAQTAAANYNGGFGAQKTAFLPQVQIQPYRLGKEGDGTLCHRHIRSMGRKFS